MAKDMNNKLQSIKGFTCKNLKKTSNCLTVNVVQNSSEIDMTNPNISSESTFPAFTRKEGIKIH